jgi:hypothetical protein
LNAALMLFAAILTGCSAITEKRATATDTETALCIAWGRSLPTRSHRDTQQTRDEITASYANFEAACPEQNELLPK